MCVCHMVIKDLLTYLLNCLFLVFTAVSPDQQMICVIQRLTLSSEHFRQNLKTQ